LLAKLLAELTKLGERLSEDRENLWRLTAAEEDLRRKLADHAELRAQVDELRRLERLVEALDALHGQQRTVTERLRQLRTRDFGVIGTLESDGRDLLRLTEEQLDAAGPQLSDTLRRTHTAQRELTEREAELDQATAKLTVLRERLLAVRDELGERVPALRRYARADRELAEALAGPEPAGTPAPSALAQPAPEGADPADPAPAEPGPAGGGISPDRPHSAPAGTALEQARAATRDMERRLAEIDRVLRQSLDERDRAGHGNGNGTPPVPAPAAPASETPD
jgi:DNA repair exonuclease SbcCD ATPase subunit